MAYKQIKALFSQRSREAGIAFLPAVIGAILVVAGFVAGYMVTSVRKAKPPQPPAISTAQLPPSPILSPEFSFLPSPTPPAALPPFPSLPAIPTASASLSSPYPSPLYTQTPAATPAPAPTPAPTRLPGLGAILWHEREEISDQGLWRHPFAGEGESATATYYSVGAFAGGAYGNGELIILEAPCTGMCFDNDFYLFAKAGGRFTLLPKHSDNAYYADSGLQPHAFTADDRYVISDLDFPKTLAQPGTRIAMELDAYRRGWFEAKGLEKIFTHPVFGDAYTDAPPHSATSGSFYGATF